MTGHDDCFSWQYVRADRLGIASMRADDGIEIRRSYARRPVSVSIASSCSDPFHVFEGHPLMIRTEVLHARLRHVTHTTLIFAAVSAGCSSEDHGSVPASPKSTPDVVQTSIPSKGGPAPRVPRGPEQAKALQEAAASK